MYSFRLFLIAVAAALSFGLPKSAWAAPSEDGSEVVRVATNAFRVRWISRDWWKSSYTNHWAVEGSAELQVKDGRLYALKPGQEATIWFRRELPANIFIRFRACPLPPAASNSANLNLFLHAREADGAPLKFGRSGKYSEYQKIPNYTCTFTGGKQPGWARLRRNPGFKLIHESPVRSEADRVYEITVAFRNGRLQYYIDGVLTHDFTDPEPLPGGWFALRTWDTIAWWDRVEIAELLEEIR